MNAPRHAAPTPRFVQVEHHNRTLPADLRPRPDGTCLLVFREEVSFAKGGTLVVDGVTHKVVVAADHWCIVEW